MLGRDKGIPFTRGGENVKGAERSSSSLPLRRILLHLRNARSIYEAPSGILMELKRPEGSRALLLLATVSISSEEL